MSIAFLTRPSTMVGCEDELSYLQSTGKLYTTAATIPKGSTVVARYTALPFYQWVEEEVKANGSELINSYAQHRYIADLWNWYQDLEDLTFKTWSDINDVPFDYPGSFVVKGETNGLKRLWTTHFFAKSRADIGPVMSRIYKDTMVGQQKLYVREFVPLVTYCEGVTGNPITREFRFFCYKDKVLAGGYYWSSHVEDLKDMGIDTTVPDAAIELATEVARRVQHKTNYFVVDVAETVSGKWMVVELNDGNMSGESEVDITVLYENLMKCFPEPA
jgi:hypothetical protein